jgi:hypothetical protein
VLSYSSADFAEFRIGQSADDLVVEALLDRSRTLRTLGVAAKSGKDAAAKFDRFHDAVLSICTGPAGGDS